MLLFNQQTISIITNHAKKCNGTAALTSELKGQFTIEALSFKATSESRDLVTLSIGVYALNDKINKALSEAIEQRAPERRGAHGDGAPPRPHLA